MQIDRASRPVLDVKRLLPPLAWLTAALALLFLMRPELDLAASALFHTPGEGFPLARDAAALAVRDALRHGYDLAAILTLALLAQAWVLRRRRPAIPARLWGFVAAAQLLGPGLVVNVVFKDHWGRARPDDVTEFGGEQAFTPAFVIADECARNCSFVSGESAAAATLALLAGVLIVPNLPPARRLFAGLSLFSVAALAGALRVAMGRHFLSDAIFGALFSALILLALWRAFAVAAVRDRITAANLRADLRLGRRTLLGWAGGLIPPPAARRAWLPRRLRAGRRSATRRRLAAAGPREAA